VNQESRSVNGKDFSALASHDDSLWGKLLGVAVTHEVYGRGKIAKVEMRPNYTPLITLEFDNCTKVWPPKSFESGKTTLWLDPDLATLADRAAKHLAAAQQAAADAARREAEELAALQEAARAEARRWASLSPAEQHRERMSALAQRHKERLDRLGLAFKGIRPSSATRFHRVTHCYECHDELDSSVDVECVACNWILCGCGACGCGYHKPTRFTA
jgi:hypothetical protein